MSFLDRFKRGYHRVFLLTPSPPGSLAAQRGFPAMIMNDHLHVFPVKEIRQAPAQPQAPVAPQMGVPGQGQMPVVGAGPGMGGSPQVPQMSPVCPGGWLVGSVGCIV